MQEIVMTGFATPGFTMPLWPVSVAACVIAWVVVAFVVGRFAARKGRPFVFYFVSSLVLGWPIPLIVALLVPGRTPSSGD
jgi:hypothetical protein